MSDTEQTEEEFIASCSEEPAMISEYADRVERESACKRKYSASNEDGELKAASESMPYETRELVLNDAELKQVNRASFTPLGKSDVYIFAARVMDSSVPTGNRRKWSREFMEDAIKRSLFVGVPLTFNHDSFDALLGHGRVYAAEMLGDETFARAYVDIRNDDGRALAEEIKAGRIKSVSINAIGKSVRQGQTEVMLPDPYNRIAELSFIVNGKKPGCSTCGIVASQKCECQSEAVNPFNEFARNVHNNMKTEFVKNASFVMGTGIKKSTYSAVAEMLDPNTLMEINSDFKKAYSEKSTGVAPVSDGSKNDADEINRVRNRMGV